MSPQTTHHSEIVLFYKYFIGHSLTAAQVEALQQHQQELCTRLKLKGRILLAAEGINGTVSAVDGETLEAYIKEMEEHELYQNIDWKRSTSSTTEPFPDLKLSIVQEIVSTGGTVKVEDLSTHGGTHLSPQQFHRALETADVVIDVRNTFEYNIGHFQNAQNPEMVTFSSFANFCDHHAPDWKDKKVLMYCTGGIRCEKASVLLKQRGCENVGQLSGGIHRYLEAYGSSPGHSKFVGKNFVFDQRVAMTAADGNQVVVGECLECHQPYDDLCGSRTCTVCRDLVLVCPACRQTKLREYHCAKHQPWKDCYFSFLEGFTPQQLQQQRDQLEQLRDGLLAATQQQTKRKRLQQKQKPPPRTNSNPSEPTTTTQTNNPQKWAPNPKNTRRTLLRQMQKIDDRLHQLESGQATVQPNAPRRCRTCSEPLTLCDGRCWGFWKTKRDNNTTATAATAPRPVRVGDAVQPGPHWKQSRLGDPRTPAGTLRTGTVVQVQSWAGQDPNDCVAVVWEDNNGLARARNQSCGGPQPQIYRWGLLAVDGTTRLYDVQKVGVPSSQAS